MRAFGFAPEFFPPLPEDHITALYERASLNEGVFRRILLDLKTKGEFDRTGTNHQTDFFLRAELDEIFDKFVRIEGHVARIEDFLRGPYRGSFECRRMGEEVDLDLGRDEAIIYLRRPGRNLCGLYGLNGNEVKFKENLMDVHYFS